MKNTIKFANKLAVILLLVALSMSNLSACSTGAHSSDASRNDSEQIKEYTFTGEAVRCNGESLSMPVAGVYLLEATKYTDGIFIYGLDDSYNARFFNLDTSSLKIDEIYDFGIEKVEAISASNDGSLHVLRIDENGDYAISSFSRDYGLLSIKVDPSYYNDSIIYTFRAVDTGFFLEFSDRIIVIDRTGELIFDYGEYHGAETIVVLQDKLLLIQIGSQNGISALNKADNTIITELDADFAPINTYQVAPLFTAFYAGASNQLLAYMNNTIYKYDYMSGTSEALLNVFTSSMEVSSLLCINEELFFTLNSGKPYIWQPISQGEATILTFATYNLSSDMEKAIKTFNSSNSLYAIEPIDYAVYDTYDSTNTGLTRLANDIISGNVPDIYDLSYFSPENFAAKGLLEDLKPYFENDDSISYDELLPCVRENVEFKNGLYELIPAFNLVTLCGDRSIVGNDWDTEKFLQITRDYPQEEVLGLGMTRAEFLSYVLSFMKNDLYSEETLECNFTSESFVSMLQFTASLPSSFNFDGTQGEAMGRAYSGEQLLIIREFGTYIVDEISLLNGIFGGEAQFVGFPTDSSSGFGISPCARLGMSSSSTSKNGVWEFFRFLLSDAVLADSNIFIGLPSTESAFEKNIDRQIRNAIAKTPSAVGVSSNGPVSFSGIPVEKDSMIQQIDDMISKADCITACDTSILNIVLNSAEAHFQGGKSAESVASEIQSKVSIYLAEQYS